MLTKCEVEPLSSDSANLFIRLFLSQEVIETDPDFEKTMNRSPLFQILSLRLKAFGNVDQFYKATLGFISTLCESPGDAVMWARTLTEIQFAEGKKIGFNELTNWFPMGFPTKEARQKAWIAQKSGGTNLVDDFNTWPGAQGNV